MSKRITFISDPDNQLNNTKNYVKLVPFRDFRLFKIYWCLRLQAYKNHKLMGESFLYFKTKKMRESYQDDAEKMIDPTLAIDFFINTAKL